MTAKMTGRELVQHTREQKGWSREHLAQKSGVSLATVTRLERIDYGGVEPTAKTWKAVALALGLDVAKVLA